MAPPQGVGALSMCMRVSRYYSGTSACGRSDAILWLFTCRSNQPEKPQGFNWTVVRETHSTVHDMGTAEGVGHLSLSLWDHLPSPWDTTHAWQYQILWMSERTHL